MIAHMASKIRTPAPGDAVVLSGAAFRLNNDECSTLVLQDGGDSEWRAKQELSLDSYAIQHVNRDIDPATYAVYRLFGDYINSAAYRSRAERPLILDVGCGIFPKLSPALERLDERCEYVGLDPLARNLERSYPFVCGRLEDLALLTGFRPRFDVFVFGTSLDHLADLPSAAAAVRRLAAPGAMLVCWNGLTEPEKIISGNGVAVFRQLLRYRFLPVALCAYAGYGLVRLPRLLRQLRIRGDKLAKGAALDHHFRWFTEANTPAYLATFGEVIDFVVLPNTNHSFATVRIRANS